ncbi:MAG: hypothetical protein U5L96_01075 [Owenweeksia sp.]|nr:hypothetical protein [Owenweeksia sp.]
MKRELHEHISRLLFDHECVTVPGFGSFLSRYHAAEVNPATHMMRPPSRRVYFNKRIQENDGLLAKSISLVEKISYPQALKLIAEQADKWQSELQLNKKLSLGSIGRMFIDESGSLRFNPSLGTNYPEVILWIGHFPVTRHGSRNGHP